MRHDLLTWIVLAFVVSALGAACTGAEPSAVPGEAPNTLPVPTLETDSAARATIATAPPLEATDVGLPTGSEESIALAREDLAQRLGLTPEAIRLVSVEAVDWPDASLGCPQPGMMYAQVITPGYRIILSASGENYEYHTSLRGVVFCEG